MVVLVARVVWVWLDWHDRGPLHDVVDKLCIIDLWKVIGTEAYLLLPFSIFIISQLAGTLSASHNVINCVHTEMIVELQVDDITRMVIHILTLSHVEGQIIGSCLNQQVIVNFLGRSPL